MSELREALIDRMVRVYGMEHKLVLLFCEICEQYPKSPMWDKVLETLTKSHEEFPTPDEDW